MDRRRFLQLSAAAAAGFASSGCRRKQTITKPGSLYPSGTIAYITHYHDVKIFVTLPDSPPREVRHKTAPDSLTIAEKGLYTMALNLDTRGPPNDPMSNTWKHSIRWIGDEGEYLCGDFSEPLSPVVLRGDLMYFGYLSVEGSTSGLSCSNGIAYGRADQIEDAIPIIDNMMIERIVGSGWQMTFGSFTPSWDGTRLALGIENKLRQHEGNVLKKGIIVDVETGSIDLDIDAPGGFYMPAWSPDGTTVAFHSSKGDVDAEVYLHDSTGTRPVVDGCAPVWSPRGDYLLVKNSPPTGGTVTYAWSPTMTERQPLFESTSARFSRGPQSDVQDLVAYTMVDQRIGAGESLCRQALMPQYDGEGNVMKVTKGSWSQIDQAVMDFDIL
ncbi:hypothetical protein COY28_04025 [Candidatus Woesearchaeota archaeon CG_4_10_14_0_2_um_filter_57_5]|nr:MAG: hypothetical protein COY28_04025 [Candidatus Woesearchaeota archaeon CG_4_10_14_0_2_um_filter_57_5]